MTPEYVALDTEFLAHVQESVGKYGFPFCIYPFPFDLMNLINEIKKQST